MPPHREDEDEYSDEYQSDENNNMVDDDEEEDGIIRFAFQKDGQSSGQLKEIHIVTPGEMIVENGSNVLCGHGTYRNEKNQLISSVCGVVEQVNKLISVRPVRARYHAEVGDVIVGRISKLAGKKWKVDVQARQDAMLDLNSVNIPGGQRRKTYEDQLNMRSIYQEDDLITAEVHRTDGSSLQLQTRSSRYGKLVNGIMIRVHPSLVKRCTQHFHIFPFGVRVILGKNGYLWISSSGKSDGDGMDTSSDSKKSSTNLDDLLAAAEGDEEEVTRPISKLSTKPGNPFESNSFIASGETIDQISIKEREAICRTRNAIMALQYQFLPIYPETILDVYESSIQIPVKEMLSRDKIPLITQNSIVRVQKQLLANEKLF
ncbi:predicted protein [Naegleria gruberi]|uniref:Predicted protein n=1 Tax=Naegleria gruberi TaxID=5762 RepID=D2VM64_NAEGR|nr:uncharacterized protein NAEGRDRAFT_50694 [Naegleria gruberi]EFC42010.1 predicted protein [Naegleria gruberi]|eukprot:XP_002674754.1 predicted protein [Naegleria gruberi strain NEG-M]